MLPDEVLTEAANERLRAIEEHETQRNLRQAHLAHGDFDTTPIFHNDGRYTGLIDFGEIRGTEPSFDLGHFLLHDGESLPFPLFDEVLTGYADVTTPPAADEIRRSAVLLGARQLARWMKRGGTVAHPIVRARVARLETLLGGPNPHPPSPMIG
jgi:aminoglycoside phosphotransferase (APT) family kinase protein